MGADEFKSFLEMASHELNVHAYNGKHTKQARKLLADLAIEADAISWRPPPKLHGTATFTMSSGGTNSTMGDVGSPVEVPEGATHVTFEVRRTRGDG